MILISLKDIAGRANMPMPTIFNPQRSAALIGFVDMPPEVATAALAVTNVDGVTDSRSVTQEGCIWKVLVPGTHFETAGKVVDGVTLKGYSEDGDGFIIGIGDLVVRAAEPTPEPGETVTNITDKTLEGETFDLDTADGENAAVRKLISKLGGTVAALAVTMAVLCTANAAPPSGYTNNTYTADGVTWTRHGSLNTRSSYVVTDAQPSSPGLATNDVCNIVTNVVEEWGNDWRVIQGVGCNVTETETYGLWEYYIEEMAQPWNTTYVYSATRLFRIDTTIPNSFHVILERNVVGRHNELGLAMVSDLPQNAPVQQLLLNGYGGTNYILKINASGGLDVFAIGE